MVARSTISGSFPRLRRGIATLAAALTIITAAAIGAAQIDAPGDSRNPNLVVDPPVVTARIFFHGHKVRISCTAPAGHEVAIVISGKEAPVELMLKGKVGGVIWSNVGDVTIDNVPSLYLLATSPGLQKLDGATASENPTVGYGALESQCRLSPAGSIDENHRIFDEFVKLKEKEELFGIAEGGVQLTMGSSEDLNCAAEFFIPPDVPVGTFNVHVLAFDRFGESVLASGVLTVEQGGPAAAIAAMARDRGLLYGVLSVIVAVVAGVFAGVVFGRSSKGGH
jgi:hypothetical protein